MKEFIQSPPPQAETMHEAVDTLRAIAAEVDLNPMSSTVDIVAVQSLASMMSTRAEQQGLGVLADRTQAYHDRLALTMADRIREEQLLDAAGTVIDEATATFEEELVA